MSLIPQPVACGEQAPQQVQIWRDGAWRAGLLVGCRLAVDGCPVALVRLTGGKPGALLVSFADLRLPQGPPAQASAAGIGPRALSSRPPPAAGWSGTAPCACR